MYKYIAIILLIIIPLSSCSESSSPNKTPEITTIKIGVLITETGAGATSGKGTKSALNFLKDNKIILDAFIQTDIEYKIELIYRDTGTDPQAALTAIENLYAQGIKLFIGPYSSAELGVLLPFVEANDLILISPSSESSTLSIEKNNIFRFIPDDQAQVIAVHKYLETESIEYLVGLYRDDLWGQDLTTSIMQNYTLGSFETDAFAYDIELNNLNEQVASFSERFREVYNQTGSENLSGYLATFSEGIYILELLANDEEINSLANLQFLGSSAFALNTDVLKNSTIAEYSIKSNFISPIFSLDINTKDYWQPILDHVKLDIGYEPDVYAVTSCDAMQILIRSYLAIEEPNNIQQLREQIIQLTNSTGISGSLELNEYQDRKTGNYDFWGIQKNTQNEYFWNKFASYNASDDSIIKY